jgi:hypothetical protein
MQRYLLFVAFLGLPIHSGSLEAQEKKENPPVTLTLSKVRGVEFFPEISAGPMKGQKVREVILACDVIIDNQTGEELTVLSNHYSAFDCLSIELLKDGKELRKQSYLNHQSLFSLEKRSYVL